MSDADEAKREFGRRLFGQPEPEAADGGQPEPVAGGGQPEPETGESSPLGNSMTEPGEPDKRGETVEERLAESTLGVLRGPAHKTEADLRFFRKLHGAQRREDVFGSE